MSTLAEIVEAMSTSYADPELQGRAQIVDPQEVADALDAVDADSVEATCLRLLAKYHPL